MHQCQVFSQRGPTNTFVHVSRMAKTLGNFTYSESVYLIYGTSEDFHFYAALFRVVKTIAFWPFKGSGVNKWLVKPYFVVLLN